MTLHKTIEVIESPNKALIIGDSFLRYLENKDNENNTTGGVFETLLKTIMYKGLEMNKASKSERAIEAITQDGRKTAETIKETIGLHFLIQYNYVDENIKKQITPHNNEYENIGTYFAELLYSSNDEKKINNIVDNILHTLKTGVQNRLQENKTLWTDLGSTYSKDIAMSFDLKENFFTFKDYFGKKLLFPNDIPIQKYASWGLIDHNTIFEGVHNIVTKKQSGFDILTMLTRIKQKGIYNDIHGFLHALQNIGYKAGTKTHYYETESWDETKGYSYDYAPYFDKSKKLWEDFCVSYVYTTPDKKSIDSEALLHDLTLIYKELCNKYSTKQHKTYDETIVSDLLEQCNDQNIKQILTYYLEKSDTVGSDTEFGRKVVIQGQQIFAILSTTKTPDDTKKSVQIQLFSSEDAAHPIRQVTYASINGQWITNDSEHTDIAYIRSFIKKKIVERNIVLDVFSHKQKELFIDGCVKSIESVLFGRTLPGIEQLQGPISLGSNIASAYLELPKKTPTESNIPPHLDLPNVKVDTKKINIDSFLHAVNTNDQRKGYTSFLPDSLAQWISHLPSSTYEKKKNIHWGALRYNAKYKEKIPQSMIQDNIHGNINDIYLNFIHDIVVEKLFSFGENKAEDQKRFIIQYKKELQYIVQNTSSAERVKKFLHEFIPVAEEKTKELMGKMKKKIEEKKKNERMSTPRNILKMNNLKEAIHEIVGPSVIDKTFSSTIIRKKDFIDFISQLQNDEVFATHIKEILNNTSLEYSQYFDQLGEKEKIYYIKRLHATSYIVPYLEKIKNIPGCENIYKDIVVLWYNHFAKKELYTLIGNMNYIAERTISSDDKNDIMEKRFKIHIEKNLLYQMIKVHLIDNIDISTQISSFDKDINNLQCAFNAYMHQKKLQEMRSALGQMKRGTKREKIIKDIANSISEAVIIQ